MSTYQANIRRALTASTSPLNIFLLGLLGVIGLVYVLVAFFTQDLLWFWPIFDEQPSAVIIHCYGQDVLLDQISPHFLQLTYLVNQQISGDKQVKTLSIASQDFRTIWQNEDILSLEMRFSSPVSIHLYRSLFSDMDSLFFVLSGDQAGRIFASRNSQPTAGYLRLVTVQPVIEYIHIEGLCTEPCKDK